MISIKIIVQTKFVTVRLNRGRKTLPLETCTYGSTTRPCSINASNGNVFLGKVKQLIAPPEIIVNGITDKNS